MIINLNDLVQNRDSSYYDRGLSYAIFENEFKLLMEAWEVYTVTNHPENASSVAGYMVGRDSVLIAPNSSGFATRRITDDRGKALFAQTKELIQEFSKVTSLVDAGVAAAQHNKMNTVDILGFGYGKSSSVFKERRDKLIVDENVIKRFSFANRHLYQLLATVRTRQLITGTIAGNVAYDDTHIALSARAEDTQSVGYKSLFSK